LAVDEVRGYGDKPVPILAEYLHQPNGFEKYHAMRFLGAIGRKSVVEPLRQVALHDPSAAYREYALAFLTQAPWELAAPILREAASRDTDLRVRQRAEELIAGYDPR
jgi:HEAT repeat protein